MLLHDAHPGYIPGSGSRRMSASSGTMRNPTARSAAAPRARGRRCCRAWLSAACAGGVRYHTRKGEKYPDYTCGDRARYETADTGCQNGAAIDRAVGELLVELMTPLTLDLALQVQDLAARAGEADLWRAQRVQRAREEANLARQRFAGPSRQPDAPMQAEWNAKLRALDEAQRA